MSRPGRKDAIPPEEPNDRGDLVRHLLVAWGELEPYVDEEKGTQLAGAERLVVDRWLSLFEPEILFVQAARNMLVHAPDALPPTQLRGAVQAASKLRDLLFSGLQNPTAVLGREVSSAS